MSIPSFARARAIAVHGSQRYSGPYMSVDELDSSEHLSPLRLQDSGEKSSGTPTFFERHFPVSSSSSLELGGGRASPSQRNSAFRRINRFGYSFSSPDGSSPSGQNDKPTPSQQPVSSAELANNISNFTGTWPVINVIGGTEAAGKKIRKHFQLASEIAAKHPDMPVMADIVVTFQSHSKQVRQSAKNGLKEMHIVAEEIQREFPHVQGFRILNVKERRVLIRGRMTRLDFKEFGRVVLPKYYLAENTVSQRPRRSLLSAVRKDRIPLWDLSQLGDDYFMHTVMGLGKLLSESGDMATLEFPRGKVTVLKRDMIGVRDPGLMGALQKRADKYDIVALAVAHRIAIRAKFGKSLERSLQDYIDRNIVSSGNQFFLSILAGDRIKPSKKRSMYYSGFEQYFIELSQELGIDPMLFALKLCVGTSITDALDLDSAKRPYNLVLTTDLLGTLIMVRPWEASWKTEKRLELANAFCAGYYYPSYYTDERPNDLNELYFAYRDGDSSARLKVAELLYDGVHRWATEQGKSETIVVPIPGREAFGSPNRLLVDHFDLPVVDPWQERPADYGQGVEGHILANKMKMVERALQLTDSAMGDISGKNVLLIDDNLTDGATYLVARDRMLAAGAKTVGIAVLTLTIRNSDEFDLYVRLVLI